ncbi:RDD family protein [Streptomyces flavofungini]|uniref:RDD family protein n=1 Tax=Streptomyces flavofungini TaxID=68200 RepID=UPI0025B0828A|nr:RDD family protein [Streptomyces flavofungini]WJV46697.1 RDD family protein [Streptomyces flavofungini]
MSNPYGPPPQQPQSGQGPGYGYPQQPPQGVPPQGGYPGQGYQAYPQQTPGQSPYGAYPQPPAGYGYGYPGGGPTVASMGRRFGARLIDGVAFIVVFVILIGAGAVSAFDKAQDCDPGSVNYDSCVDNAASDLAEQFGAVFIVFAIVGLLYEWLMTMLVGGTLGKLAVGIRVVDSETGQNPGAGASFVRWIIPMVGAFVFIGQLLVYLSPFWDNSGKQQGWHDKAAKTMVIQRSNN